MCPILKTQHLILLSKQNSIESVTFILSPDINQSWQNVD